MTWNKSQKITRRGTKAQRWRPESEWLRREAPELRIVDEELWQRVHARREARAASYLRRSGGRLVGSPSGADVESPYLLSGLARCAECGGSLVAMTRSHGKRRMPYYGCLRFHKRGVRACRNGLQIRQAVLDSAVLDVLAKKLDAEVIAEAVHGAVADLSASQADRTTRRVAITAELAQIATRERRLLDALVDGHGDATAASIRGRLREELARRDALTAELAQLDAIPALDADALARGVAGRAADLRAALGRNIPQARQVVRQLLDGRLLCAPFDDGKEHGYTFEATGTYRRLGVPTLDTLVNVCGGPNGKRHHDSGIRVTLRSSSPYAARFTAPM